MASPTWLRYDRHTMAFRVIRLVAVVAILVTGLMVHDPAAASAHVEAADSSLPVDPSVSFTDPATAWADATAALPADLIDEVPGPLPEIPPATQPAATDAPAPPDQTEPSPSTEPDPIEAGPPEPTPEPGPIETAPADPVETQAPDPTPDPQPTAEPLPPPIDDPEPSESAPPAPTVEPLPEVSLPPAPTPTPVVAPVPPIPAPSASAPPAPAVPTTPPAAEPTETLPVAPAQKPIDVATEGLADRPTSAPSGHVPTHTAAPAASMGGAPAATPQAPAGAPANQGQVATGSATATEEPITRPQRIGATDGADDGGDASYPVRVSFLEDLEPVSAGVVASIVVSNRVPAVAVAVEFGKAGSGWAGAIVFNLWLRRQLRERRMSQRQLATLSGVNHSTVSRLLRYDRHPSLETATKLAKALRQAGGELDTADYFDRLPEEALFPARRVEMALRADDVLEESDVQRLMWAYLRARQGNANVPSARPGDKGGPAGEIDAPR